MGNDAYCSFRYAQARLLYSDAQDRRNKVDLSGQFQLQLVYGWRYDRLALNSFNCSCQQGCAGLERFRRYIRAIAIQLVTVVVRYTCV